MTKLQQAQQLILNLGRVIRSMDEENHWLEYWTQDGEYQSNSEYQVLFGPDAEACQESQAVHIALKLAEADTLRTENEALRAALAECVTDTDAHCYRVLSIDAFSRRLATINATVKAALERVS